MDIEQESRGNLSSSSCNLCVLVDQLPLKIKSLLPSAWLEIRSTAGSVARSILRSNTLIAYLTVLGNYFLNWLRTRTLRDQLPVQLPYVINKLPRSLRYDLLLTLSENEEGPRDRLLGFSKTSGIRYHQILR